MAARTRRIVHDENTRLKIKTSQLMNRLTDHALGKIELSQTQVTAINILLKKTLPDLQAIHTTEQTAMTFEDWLDQTKNGSDENRNPPAD